MEKFSQKELLEEEGFLDSIRNAGRLAKTAVTSAIKNPLATVGALAKGAAKGIYDMDPEGFDTIAKPLKTVAAPFTKALSQFSKQDASTFLLRTLVNESAYRLTFYPKTIKILDILPDPRKTNFVNVRFQASRVDNTAPTSQLSTKSAVYSMDRYTAVIEKQKNNELKLHKILDKNNHNVYQGNKEQNITKPNFNRALAQLKSATGNVIDAAHLSSMLQGTVGLKKETIQTIATALGLGVITSVDEFVQKITGVAAMTDQINDSQIQAVYDALKKRAIVEKVGVSQKVLLEQLKNLSQ